MAERKPLPKIPTVRIREQDVDEHGNLKNILREAPINELAAIHIQRFLDDRRMRREYNVITDDIAAARDQLQYMAVLTTHLLKLEEAKRDAIERNDPEHEDLDKLYQEVKKALDVAKYMAERSAMGEPRGAAAVIEARRKAEQQQEDLVEATKKSSTYLERLLNIEEKREHEVETEFTEKGQRRKRDKTQDDDDDYDIDLENQKKPEHGLLGTLLGINLLKGIFQPGDPRVGAGGRGIWSMLGRYGPIVVAAARAYLTINEIVTGWIEAERRAVGTGTSILASILGGAEKDETWMEKWLNIPVLGLGLAGAKIGKKFGVLGMLSGLLVGGAVGVAIRALGPDRWSSILADMQDTFGRWVDRVFGSSFRLNEEELAKDVNKLRTGIDLVRKNIQDQESTIRQLQQEREAELAKPQREQDVSKIAHITERLKIEEADLARLHSTLLSHYRRIQQNRTDFEETMMRLADAEIKRLQEGGYDLFGEHAYMVENINKKYEEMIRQNYEQNKEIYDQADKIVGQTHQKKWKRIEGIKRPDRLFDGSVNLGRTIEPPFMRLWRERENQKKQQQSADPELLEKMNFILPQSTERLMKAEKVAYHMQQSQAAGAAGGATVVSPSVTNSQTTNIANNQTSIYHVSQPYLINDRMDRLLMLGWA